MIPEERLSTTAVPGGWLNPPSGLPRTSFHWGPVALQDASEGLLYQLWTAGVDVATVYVSAPNTPRTDVFTRANEVEEVSLAFDQNGFATVAFVEDNGSAWLHWYDTSIPAYVTTALAAGVINPRVTLDDARGFASSYNDVILAYIRSGNLYYRQQRDRFLIERLLANDATKLYHVSMSTRLRLQFTYEGVGMPDSPFLADVVKDLCKKSGIPEQNIDVDELYTDRVHGLRVDSDEGMTEPVDQLRKVFFFDKSDYDRKLHFPKRGRDVQARIPYAHLITAKGGALKQERVDETELAREVNINHLDPDGGFAKNKQYAQRRSNLVNAQGKKNIDTQVVLTVDQAATAAETLLRIDWNELIEYEFATSIYYTYLTNGDVIEVEDKGGTWHRMRIEEKNEDGDITWKCRQDAGQRTYGATRTGNVLPPPISTTPGLIGETLLELVNSSPFRDQDDELGVYVAAAGTSSAWTGYQLLVSTDLGTTYTEAYTATSPSTIGETVQDLAHALGYEYQSTQSVELTTNFPLVSISYEQMLGNQNRCVIGDEVLQFQTATFLGMVGNQYHYRISGLLRGRYATPTPDWPAGTRFVLIDETLVFVQAQRSMLGMDIYYKPVSLGLTEDETVPTAYLFDEPMSQTEWPVHAVTAVRAGADAVVNWIGCARLGNDTVPFHSKYFAGYRVKFSNGHTIDTTSQTATYAGAPGSIGVQVCALNTITGEGPYSASITV